MADMNIRYEELLAHRKGQPAYAAVLGGVDALVFTAGIGENDAQLRAKVVAKLAWMGRKARLRRKRPQWAAHLDRGQQGLGVGDTH